MKLFRIALLATGVGAVIVGIIALANAMSSMGDNTEEATKKLEKQNEAREKAIDLAREEADALNENRKTRSGGANDLKRELDLLVAKGATAEKVYEATKKLKEKERDDINYQIGYLASDNKMQVKLGQDLLDKKNELAVLEADFNKKQEDENKKNQEKRNAEAKARQDDRLKKSIEDFKSREQIAQNEKEFEANLLEEDRLANEKEEQRKREDTAFNIAWSIEQYQYEKAQKKKIQEQALADQKVIEEARLSIMRDSYLVINNLGELAVGQQFKNTAVGKTLALTQIAIDTAMAISSLTKNSQANPTNAVTGGISGIAQFASGMVQITGNMLKAKSILNGGGNVSTGGGGASGSAMGGGNVSSQPPRLDTFQSNRTPMNANQRVYVLEKDITDSQGRVARIRHNATLI
jgi:uncharacterized membrane protein YgcG